MNKAEKVWRIRAAEEALRVYKPELFPPKPQRQLSRIQDVLRMVKDRRYPKATKEKPYFVYFIGCNSHVKIGITSDLGNRIRELQVGNPVKLKLLGVVATDKPLEDESYLHSSLSQYRQSGEWFKVPKEILSKLVAGDWSEIQPLTSTH